MRTITNTTHATVSFVAWFFPRCERFHIKRLHDRFQRKTESNWHIGQSGAASHSRAASWSFSVQTKSKTKFYTHRDREKRRMLVSAGVFSRRCTSQKRNFFALFSMHLTYFWYFTENFARKMFFCDKVEDSIRKKN